MCNLLTSFVSLLFLLKAANVHRRKQKCVKEKIKGTLIPHLENKCWDFDASLCQCPAPGGRSAGVCGGQQELGILLYPRPPQGMSSIHPSIHALIPLYSFIRLCATPWRHWCWRHWLLGTDDKVLLAEGPVQGRKTIKKETQKGRSIFANPDHPDQSHPHCYRGRRLRPQRQLGVTQQVHKAPCWAPGWTF